MNRALPWSGDLSRVVFLPSECCMLGFATGFFWQVVYFYMYSIRRYTISLTTTATTANNNNNNSNNSLAAIHKEPYICGDATSSTLTVWYFLDPEIGFAHLSTGGRRGAGGRFIQMRQHKANCWYCILVEIGFRRCTENRRLRTMTVFGATSLCWQTKYLEQMSSNNGRMLQVQIL